MWLKCIKIININLFLLISVIISCSASSGGTPLNVRITNVRGTQFTVSWISAEEEIGRIRYGISKDNFVNWKTENDDRGTTIKDDIHHVTLTGLKSNTTHYYEIISGSMIDNNSGNYYSLNPGPVLLAPPDSCLPAGKVFKDQAKSRFAYDSIAYVTILGSTEEENSATESVLVTQATNAYWFVDLVNFRTKDFSDIYSYICGTSHILVEAESGNSGSAKMDTEAIDFSIAERPEMILSVHTNINLSAGFNLFSYPVNVPQDYTSYQLIDDLGAEDEVYKIQRYNANTKSFVSTTYENGNPSGDDFTIINGEGYIGYMKADKNIPFVGSIAYPMISLKKGVNLISLPRISSDYTLYNLISYLGYSHDVSSIHRFNSKKGEFLTAYYFYGNPSGNNFKIDKGETYIVHMNVDKDKNSP